MCTSIVEIVAAEGMAKREDEWFPLTHTVVAYDHARHAVLGDVITLDFINSGLPPGARAGVELTLESAKALAAALEKAIAEAEIEEADRAEGIERARLAAERRPPWHASLHSDQQAEDSGHCLSRSDPNPSAASASLNPPSRRDGAGDRRCQRRRERRLRAPAPTA